MLRMKYSPISFYSLWSWGFFNPSLKCNALLGKKIDSSQSLNMCKQLIESYCNMSYWSSNVTEAFAQFLSCDPYWGMKIKFVQKVIFGSWYGSNSQLTSDALIKSDGLTSRPPHHICIKVSCINTHIVIKHPKPK